mmetsp:Transcript_34851/g.56219  ORF Transcript_34851/g.56219 Transcript_34851/m.56219 type:complete len:224 (+) Transcript_34851:1171-1842(+)
MFSACSIIAAAFSSAFSRAPLSFSNVSSAFALPSDSFSINSRRLSTTPVTFFLPFSLLFFVIALDFPPLLANGFRLYNGHPTPDCEVWPRRLNIRPAAISSLSLGRGRRGRGFEMPGRFSESIKATPGHPLGPSPPKYIPKVAFLLPSSLHRLAATTARAAERKEGVDFLFFLKLGSGWSECSLRMIVFCIRRSKAFCAESSKAREANGTYDRSNNRQQRSKC